MRRALGRLIREDGGQDTIEYVLLTATIGLSAIATWPFIESAIGLAYRQLDTNTQNLWIPPDPGGGS